MRSSGPEYLKDSLFHVFLACCQNSWRKARETGTGHFTVHDDDGVPALFAKHVSKKVIFSLRIMCPTIFLKFSILRSWLGYWHQKCLASSSSVFSSPLLDIDLPIECDDIRSWAASILRLPHHHQLTPQSVSFLLLTFRLWRRKFKKILT